MKIGIITFSCSHNYGAQLQCYGLQQFLKGLGHEVYVIDYRPQYKLNWYKKWNIHYWLSKNPIKCVDRLITEIKVKHTRIKRWNKIHKFSTEHLNLYPYVKGSSFKEFDLMMIGSDQVWNPKLTGGYYDGMFYGVGFECAVASYAASSKEVTARDLAYLRDKLRHFVGISVREDSFREKLISISDKEIHTVLDPTLLAGETIYDSLTTDTFGQSEYMIVYEVKRDKVTREIASRISQKLGLKVIEISPEPLLSSSSEFELMQTASPQEFVNLFKYASFIVTSSFHGLAFSILYKKQFYAIKKGTLADDRLGSLLNKLGLECRFIKSVNEIEDISIDYEKVMTQLDKERRYSADYINDVIKKVETEIGER